MQARLEGVREQVERPTQAAAEALQDFIEHIETDKVGCGGVGCGLLARGLRRSDGRARCAPSFATMAPVQNGMLGDVSPCGKPPPSLVYCHPTVYAAPACGGGIHAGSGHLHPGATAAPAALAATGEACCWHVHAIRRVSCLQTSLCWAASGGRGKPFILPRLPP